MTVARTLRPWWFLGGGILAAACASGAPRLGEAETCRITLVDRRGGRAFHLVNEAFAPRAAYYSRLRADAATKVLERDTMQYLLDGLAEEGFASRGAPGEAVSGESASPFALTVERGGVARTVERRAGDSATDAQSLARMVARFREVYDSTSAFQSIEHSGGREYFDRARRAVEPASPGGARPRGE